MTPNEGPTVPEGRLEWILAQINEWLKFAEAKNGALVVLSAAILTGSTQVLPAEQTVIIITYRWSLWLFGSLAFLVSLFSFLPQTAIPILRPNERRERDESLLFFGNAKKYTPNEYLGACTERYGVTATAWDRDLAGQIIINSRIAVWKYTCFKVALWTMVWALLTPALGALVVALLYAWNQRQLHKRNG